jgi:hypothetical protein
MGSGNKYPMPHRQNSVAATAERAAVYNQQAGNAARFQKTKSDCNSYFLAAPWRIGRRNDPLSRFQ